MNKCICLIVFLFLYSCSTSKEQKGLKIIDIDNTFNQTGVANISMFADSIQYVELESSPQTFYNGGCRIYKFNNELILISPRKILLFNANTGKLIREIGHQGKDPLGYRYAYSHINISDTVVYAKSYKGQDLNTVIYDLQGEILDTIISPDEYAIIYPFKKDEYYGYIDNDEGNEDSRIFSFDKKGKVIKYFKNYQKYSYDFDGIRGAGLCFYKFKGLPRFKEFYNDTIFEINNNSLIAKYAFNCGNKSLPYKMRGKKDFSTNNYFSIYNPLETDNFIFYGLGYQNSLYTAVFIKNTNKNAFAKNDVLNKTKGGNNYGFHNDIDNFLPFQPLSITKDRKYLVGYIEMTQVIEWFEENPDKVARLPENLKKLGKKSIEDNPIVMIVKLKQ